jgi:biopolymer transport protein ExbD
MNAARVRRAVINVVPLLDVLVVMVFFLLVTLRANDPRALQVSPPAAASAAETSLAGAVVVAVDAPGALFVEAKPVTAAALPEALRAALQDRAAKEVVVVADERASTGATVRAVDAAVLAGAAVRIQARAPGAPAGR